MEAVIEAPDGQINWHVHCIECGYDLYGLAEGGMCPECGTELAASMRGEFLRFANLRWLQTVRRGIMMMYYALTFGVLVGLVGGFLAAALPGTPQSVFSLLGIGVGLLTVGGVYATTAQEPASSGSPDGTRRRDVLRAAAVTNLLGIIVTVATEQAGLLMITYPAMILASLAALAVVFWYFGFVKTLATRIPDAKLRKAASSAQWCMTIGNALLLPEMCLDVYVQMAAPGAGSPVPIPEMVGDILTVLKLIGALLFLIFLIRGLRALLGYRKAFKAAIGEAEGIASAAVPASA